MRFGISHLFSFRLIGGINRFVFDLDLVISLIQEVAISGSGGPADLAGLFRRLRICSDSPAPDPGAVARGGRPRGRDRRGAPATSFAPGLGGDAARDGDGPVGLGLERPRPGGTALRCLRSAGLVGHRCLCGPRAFGHSFGRLGAEGLGLASPGSHRPAVGSGAREPHSHPGAVFGGG